MSVPCEAPLTVSQLALERADKAEAPRNRNRQMECCADLTPMPTLDDTVELNRSLHR